MLPHGLSDSITCSEGEPFVVGKHKQGTEIKAITWHDLEIYDDDEDNTHVRVLVDI